MKKILGIIVLVGLLVLIGFGFTYKMVEPDGWDRVVETVVEKMPVLENIIPEKTPAPQPTATPTPEVTVAPNVGGDSEVSYRNEESGTATAKPTATPEASATPAPTPEVDFENMDYPTYNSLSAETQKEFFDSFSNPEDFFDWYNNAKEEHDNAILIEGEVNMEEILNSSKENKE